MSGANSGGQKRPPDKPITVDDDGFTVPIAKRGRGRPKKQRVDDDVMSVTSLVSGNTYDSLTDDDTGDCGHLSKKNRVVKMKRPPPIVLPNLNSRKDVDAIMEGIPIEKSNILRRITREGTRLFVSTTEKFKALRSHFAKANCKFTSYTLHEDMVTRYVMYGLPEHNPREVQEALSAALKQAPFDLKQMKINKKSYTDQANYLVYFKKSAGITLLHLKSITGILGYRVYFSKYQKSDQPTQCYNCQRYSHASANCWLDPRCMRCGGPHKSTDCPLVDKRTLKIPDDKVKCINCDGKHTSNSKDCPSRIKIVKDRQELVNKRTNTAKGARYVKNYSNNYDSHFPDTIRLNRNVNKTTERNTTYTPYSQVVVESTQPFSNSNSTFKPSQLMSIFKQMVHICSSCRTVEEQLTALAAIVEKYLCHD